MRSDAIQKQQFEIEYFFLLSKLLSKSIKHMIRWALKPKQKKKIIYFLRTQYNCAIERGINRGKNSIFFFCSNSVRTSNECIACVRYAQHPFGRASARTIARATRCQWMLLLWSANLQMLCVWRWQRRWTASAALINYNRDPKSSNNYNFTASSESHAKNK